MQTQTGAKTRSAVVIGGGIIGLCCALELQRRGIATTLFSEECDPPNASWGNAGHIAIEQVEPLASIRMLKSLPTQLFWRGGALSLPLREMGAWLPFSLKLLNAARPRTFRRGSDALASLLGAAMPAWRRLAGTIGSPDLLIENGHFVVWETPRTAQAGRKKWAQAQVGTTRFRDASAAELEAIAGQLAVKLAGGIRFEGSGHIADLAILAKSAGDCFEREGGKLRRERIDRVVAGEGQASVFAGGREISADAVVVAAGIGSKALLEPLGYRVPMIAERGYHIQSAVADQDAPPAPVVFEDRSMIVTPFRSGLRAASFVEFGRIGGAPDRRKWKRLRAHVDALGLAFAAPVTEWSGARPTLPDYLPAIGRSRRSPSLYYAFGHQHLGLTLGPLTGELIGALVAGEEPPLPTQPFDLDRFQRKLR